MLQTFLKTFCKPKKKKKPPKKLDGRIGMGNRLVYTDPTLISSQLLHVVVYNTEAKQQTTISEFLRLLICVCTGVIKVR